MKNLLVLSVFTASVAFSWAQNGETDFRESWQFGLKIGANYSDVYNTSGEDFHPGSKLGMAAGLFGMIPFNKYIGLQPEILYSQKGFKATGTLLGTSYDLTRTTSYIDVPIYLVLKPSEFFSLMAGPQYSFLIHQKDAFANGSSSIEQENEFENDSFHKHTLCFAGGLDVNIDHVVIGLRAGIDALHNRSNSASLTPRYNNVWYQATIGYRFF